MPAAAATPKFGRVALIGKSGTPDVEASLREMRDFLRRRGCDVKDAAGAADLAIVIGGDGTMLAAARELVQHHVPLVGINQGRLGFMTDVGHDDMHAGVGAILDGKYSIEERSLLDAAAAVVKPGGVLVYSTCSLEPEENGLQIENFLERQNGAFALAPPSSWHDETQLTPDGLLLVLPGWIAWAARSGQLRRPCAPASAPGSARIRSSRCDNASARSARASPRSRNNPG